MPQSLFLFFYKEQYVTCGDLTGETLFTRGKFLAKIKTFIGFHHKGINAKTPEGPGNEMASDPVHFRQ